jgi:predicted nucleic acid-binding protein
VTFDTTFFMSHYFSENTDVLGKTKEILRRSRLQGNCGIVPTIVLAEFYAQAAKRIGAAEAERRFNEIADSGLEIQELNTIISKRAAVIRHKYLEKIPWGDCLIAATSLESRTQYVITEDPEFKSIKEVKSKRIEDINV